MPYIDPNNLTIDEQQGVVEWLQRNGLRHVVSLDPIVVRGSVVEYTALCRAHPLAHLSHVGAMADERDLDRRIRNGEVVPLGRRRLRIRHPRRAGAAA